MKMIVARAVAAAVELNHDSVGPEHLLMAVSSAEDLSPAGRCLRDLGVTEDAVRDFVRGLPDGYRGPVSDTSGSAREGRPFGPDGVRAFARAEGLAVGLGSPLSSEHLVLSILSEGGPSIPLSCLRALDLTPERVLARLPEYGISLPPSLSVTSPEEDGV